MFDQAEWGEIEAEEAGTPDFETGEDADERESVPRRVWGYVAYVLAWLRRPDELGQPITLQPQGLRLLLLLILGNMLVLVLLTIGLLRASSMPAMLPLQSPPVLPTTVITVISAGPSPTPGPTPTPFGRGGAIAFTLRQSGNADVYALNQSDLQLVRLTYDPAEDRDPTWSPDGNYVAFASNRADNWDIYLLDLLSGALIRLTHDPAFDGNPSWSPDGRWIAFESYRRGNLDIYVMSVAEQQLRRITTDRVPNYEPVWSPDSRAIAYTTFDEGNKDIHVRMLDGQGEVANVTQSPDMDEDQPAWSPDGTQLAYVSGSRGNPSIQVTAFDWETMAADQAQTELFGAGLSPTWAPDGHSIIYAYERGGYSHLVAASTAGWALFHEVYSVEGPLDDIAWTSVPLSPRIVARARADAPAQSLPLYMELMQPTPTAGSPYNLVVLSNVMVQVTGEEEEEEVLAEADEDADENENADASADENENGEENTAGDESEDQDERESGDENEPPDQDQEERERKEAFLSDRVNESFNALRRRVIEEAGWDYLAELGLAQLPMDFTPYSGQSRMSWHVCGRAIGLNQNFYGEASSQIELVREDVGNVTYWRVFIRAAEQDGRMGEPLREGVWDLNARQEDGRTMVEGGELKEQIPPGYYVDFTTLAGDYGWERVPSLWRWRYFWPDIRWWRYRKTDGMTWWECMLEVFDPEEIEDSFGPIPGYEE